MNDTPRTVTVPQIIGDRLDHLREPLRSIGLLIGTHVIMAVEPGRRVGFGRSLDAAVTCNCGQIFDGFNMHALHVAETVAHTFN